MTAHARPGLAERLAGRFRRRQPDLYPMRTVDYGGGPKIVGFWGEPPDGAGRAKPRPPWQTAPQPAQAGPGKLGAFHAAADLRDQRAHLAGGHDLTVIDDPVARTRPYAPEPELEPDPEPVPEPAWYPPLDLHADLAECLIFRDAVRDHLVRQERAQGNLLAGPWLQAYADVFARRIAPDWRAP